MIIIDGETFNVPIVSMDGRADALDKYAERTNDGVLQRQLIGIYDNYDIQFGSSYPDVSEYERLWNKLTESVPWHTVVFPTFFGSRAIEGYFANTKHKISRQKDGVTYWKDLSTSFVSRCRRPV